MINLLLVILVLTYLLYKYLTRNFDYWEKRNVPYPKPLPLFGNYYEVFTFRISIGKYIRKLYDKFTSPYFGIFSLNKPYLVIKCPKLIKAILIKDFHNFCDRAILCNEDCDSISGNMLFFVNNPRWKVLRLKTAPAFSNLKIKGMFNLMYEASKDMNNYIKTHYQKQTLDAKELCAKYTTDVIASCAFGIQARCFEDENADFRKVGKEMFKLDLLSAARQFCYIMMPSIVELFKFTFFKTSVYNFLRKGNRRIQEKNKYKKK